jgi:hypothetical protein
MKTRRKMERGNALSVAKQQKERSRKRSDHGTFAPFASMRLMVFATASFAPARWASR